MGARSDLLRKIDELIRGGRIGTAQTALTKELRRGRPGREELLLYARLARRVGWPEVSVRLLRPIVRPERERTLKASASERVEYALGLIRLGVIAEGLALLEEKEASGVPDSLLFRAFGLFAQWRYEEAIPLLDSYLSSPLSEYERLVGQINLAEAQVFVGARDRARPLLEESLRTSGAFGAVRLQGACLRLQAQLAIDQGRYDEADVCLDHAEGTSGANDSTDQFLIQKWRAVGAFLRDGGRGGASAALDALAAEACRRGHWETMRDCDFYRAIYGGRSEFIAHLYFGTPFDDYRKRILSSLPGNFELPGEYVWTLGTKAAGARILDLEQGLRAKGRGGLRQGFLMFNLIRALARDFYRPARASFLYAQLFPGEHFNPATSLHRVHELVNRLRAWCRHSETSLGIQGVGGNYQLLATGPLGIRLTLDRSPRSPAQASLETLHSRFSGQSFSSEDAAKVLNISSRTVRRMLGDASKAGRILSEGQGPARKYRLAA